ncbi:MAG: T9SS type A sorting domain-containing protein [Bacteroidota bacterium]|nr:T9SS type A sorting domain-containing protein [Bacteroidota bacterium]
MLKKLLFIFVLFLFKTGVAQSTWATDVAPILYQHCTSCHNPSGIAPFSLITYADAFPNAGDMANEVSQHLMPPWPPDTSYTRYCNERTLSQAQIQTIVDWAANGAQPGNLSAAPTPPTYAGNAVLTNPDLIAQIPLYTVNTATDLYRCFVVPSGVSTTEYITKIEVIPGNRSIVHHVLVYQDQANTCINLDNADPAPGYTNFGGVGSNTATLVLGWVPGQGMYSLPATMGIRLEASTNLIFQVHYPGGTFNQIDSTQVRMTFSTGLVRNVSLAPVINHSTSLTNGPLYIPADSIRTFYAQETVSIDATIISIAPHMHLIGQNITNYAVTPLGDTIPLIRINDWDFHWQGFYNYRQPVHVPYGSVLYAHAAYDNSANNPENPNSPPQAVSVGEATTDEMFIVYYAYLPYQWGDEDIIIDSTSVAVLEHSYNDLILTPQLYEPFPVPSANGQSVTLSYFLPNKTSVKMELIDISGKIVSVPVENVETSAGFGKTLVNTSGLSKGTYIVRLTADGNVKTKSLIIQ